MLPLDLVLRLNCASLSLLIDVVKTGPYLVELGQRGQHEALVLKHANGVVGLHGHLNRGES